MPNEPFLMIERLPHGGFVVRRPGYQGDMTVELLASTTIDEALRYIKDVMEASHAE